MSDTEPVNAVNSIPSIGKVEVWMDTPFPAYRGDGPYVFVCYSREDQDTVYPEIDWLREQGTNVWYDEGVSAGQIWRAEIAEALDSAVQVLFYISSAALRSMHCNQEINYALDKGCLIVPIYLEEIDLTPDLEIGLVRLQALHPRRDSHYRQRLYDAVTRATSTSPDLKPEATDKKRRQIDPNMGPSIVVLPFASLTGDPEDEYFSDGVAEEIRNVLSNVPGLSVTGRTSAQSFKHENVDVGKIARELSVNHILEGSVRRSGDRVRVRVQLIDAEGGFGEWSESFDASLSDIFAVQDQIAGAVAEALRVELVNQPVGATTGNMEAYNAVLRGRSLTIYGEPHDLHAAIGYFEHAIELDPAYGAAYGELALARALTAVYTPTVEIADAWEAAFTGALAINPSDANALSAKACYLTMTQWDWAQAGELYRQAVEIGISANAAKLYGSMYLAALGKWDEFRSFYEKVLETDPYNLDVLWDLANFSRYFETREFSLQTWERLLAVQPGYVDAWASCAFIHATAGDHAAARTALGKVAVRELNPYSWREYLGTLYLMNEQQELQRLLSDLEALDTGNRVHRVALTWAYVYINEPEKALAGLEADIDSFPWVAIFLRMPIYTALAGPRFDVLLRRTHLDDASLIESGVL